MSRNIFKDNHIGAKAQGVPWQHTHSVCRYSIPMPHSVFSSSLNMGLCFESHGRKVKCRTALGLLDVTLNLSLPFCTPETKKKTNALKQLKTEPTDSSLSESYVI